MKLKYIIIFFTFLTYNVSAQLIGSNNKMQIEYDVTYNNDITIVKKGILIPNVEQKKSSYYEYNKNKNIESTTKNEGNKTVTSLFIGDFNFIERNFLDLRKRELYSIEKRDFDKKTYKINEELPKLNWNLQSKDTLNISGYTCNKATVYFRGRNYIAWYSKKIPVPYGPWKFYGLPGLIFKVYDETIRYDWTIQEIKKRTVDENILNKKKHDVELNLKEFIVTKNKLKSKKLDQMKKNTTTRQPRGTRVIFEVNKGLGRSQELIFEWEKEITKN